MEYSEKLKDPRWQKKRLEILQRDKFTCRKCGDKKSTLHIHHKKYINGKEPWEYSKKDLITLCGFCHDTITDIGKKKGINDFEKIRIRKGENDNYITIYIKGGINGISYAEFVYDSKTKMLVLATFYRSLDKYIEFLREEW